MTNQQLYLSVGLPILVFLFGFITMVWQIKGVEGRLDRMEDRIEKKLDFLIEHWASHETRIARLEPKDKT